MIRIVRSVAAALALTAVAVPATALADATPGTPPAARAGDKAAKKAKDKGAKQFPMKAATFKDHVEKRIAKAREKLGEQLERHNVPQATRDQVMKDFEAGAVAVRAAADRVAKDGEVTQQEAKEVRDLAKDLKQKAREKYLGQKKDKRPAKKG